MHTETLQLHNSDGRKLQDFIPIEPRKVRLYCCGPTVYDYAHIGNLRAYTHWDILRRTLTLFDYQVKHVMNITDVGHLSDNADSGEDKMLESARRQEMSVWEIADFYTKAFFKDIERMNILLPHIACRATEHIPEMIELVQRLIERKLAYVESGNVYFDTAKYPEYGRMALIGKQNLQHGSRVDIDENKHNPLDFVLWFTKGKFEHQAMLWDSPWGRGYPGWHLECSAMSTKYLGERIDIHTGGVDHIQVHHTNEIAQSEGVLGHRWVNYWIHNEFLIMKNQKLSKSEGEIITLQSLCDMGFHPLDYRYFILGGHYRTQLIYSQESLENARMARKSLNHRVGSLKEEIEARKTGEGVNSETGDSNFANTVNAVTGNKDDFGHSGTARIKSFRAALGEDMNTPRALAELWLLLKDRNTSPEQKLSTVLEMDRVFGLDLASTSVENSEKLSGELNELLDRRQRARKAGDWTTADQIRDTLLKLGWKVSDRPSGPKLEKL